MREEAINQTIRAGSAGLFARPILIQSNSAVRRSFMKKSVALFLLIAFVLVAFASAAEPSAKKIIDRYRKATGASALKKVKNTRMIGKIRTGDGAEGSFTYRATLPDRIRVDIEAGNQKLIECYNGKSAWRMDYRGLRTLLGAEAKRLRLEAIITNSRLDDLKRSRIIAQQPVKTTVEEREAYSVEFVKDDARVRLFFDAASNLLIKQERETSDGPEEIFYGDHRPVDKVMEPFSIRTKNRAGEMSITLDSVEHNTLADEVAYRYPQVEDARPLPDIETLMKSIVANQEKIEEMRERYTCRATEIERKLDGNGRVKETETKVYEVTPIGDEFVERLISLNGKELSEKEREKEDKRVEKEVQEIIKRQEKKEKKRERARERGEKEDSDERLTILDFLHVSEVTSVRRETFRGYEVIAFDFEPKKGYKPRNRAESIAAKLAGTLWVDEKAQQITRLEARLIDSFKMGGGLVASISPSTAFAFEQEKVDSELWLPSFAEGNISARIMLFAKLNRSFERRYSDYKKYQIDSSYEIGKPKESKPEGKN